MTSKQAFEKIREIMEQYYHQFVKDNIKLETIEGYPINKIEKDLEMLEIVRKFLLNKTMTEEEYEKFKEWLINE